MREILFRGKRKGNGEWVYGDFIQDWHNHDTKPIFKIHNNLGSFTVIPETVSEFTSLYDMHGKKIFEGDVLKGKHEWRNWNTSFGNDEKDFLEQKIKGAYGKYIDKTANEFIKWRYHYFRNYAVEYYAPNGGYRVRNGGQFHRLDQSYIFNRELEIIGNIHDNPELLRKEDEGK